MVALQIFFIFLIVQAPTSDRQAWAWSSSAPLTTTTRVSTTKITSTSTLFSSQSVLSPNSAVARTPLQRKTVSVCPFAFLVDKQSTATPSDISSTTAMFSDHTIQSKQQTHELLQTSTSLKNDTLYKAVQIGSTLCKAIMLSMAKVAVNVRGVFYQGRRVAYKKKIKNEYDLRLESLTNELYDKSVGRHPFAFLLGKRRSTDPIEQRHMVARHAGGRLMLEILRILLNEDDPNYKGLADITTVFAGVRNLPAYTVSSPKLLSIKDIPAVVQFSQVVTMQFERTYEGILDGRFGESVPKASEKLARIHAGLNISGSMFDTAIILLMGNLQKVTQNRLEEDSKLLLHSIMGNDRAFDGVVKGSIAS